MGKMPDITFPPEAEKMAITLAAFDIMKQLFKEGMITEAELMYLAEKHEIPIDID